MEKIDNGISWLERVLAIIDKYRFKTILKAVGIIFLIALTVGIIQHPTWLFERYQEWEEKQHTEKLTHRLQHNEKLHILMEKLLYKVNADRVLLLELHNGTTGVGNLPFAKCSATYEALKNVDYPVADQYQDLNLSLMPFASVLFNNGYWCGNTDELKEIDKALCYKMLGNDISHFAGIVIKGVEQPLAFLLVKFQSIEDNHNCEEVHKILNENALQIALMLELNREL
jgi:hypothetical protein